MSKLSRKLEMVNKKKYFKKQLYRYQDIRQNNNKTKKGYIEAAIILIDERRVLNDYLPKNLFRNSVSILHKIS